MRRLFFIHLVSMAKKAKAAIHHHQQVNIDDIPNIKQSEQT